MDWEWNPTLAAKPAELVLGSKIPGKHVEAIGIAGGHAIVEIEGEDHSSLVQLELATGAQKQLYRTAHALDLGVCARTAARCVVREIRPRKVGERTGDDPATLLLLDGTKVTPLAIPTTAYGLLAISDHGRFLVTSDVDLVAWDLASRKKLATLHDPAGGKQGSSEISGWRGDVAVVAFEPLAEGARPTFSLWHFDTDRREPVAEPDETHDPVAPDGSRRVDFAGGKATITPLPSGAPRTLALYGRDYEALADGVTQWLDARTIAIPGKAYWAFLDTDAMKVSLLPAPPPGEDPPHLAILRGTGHVLATTSGATFLATVKP